MKKFTFVVLCLLSGSMAMADDNLTSAFKACLNQSVKNKQINLDKSNAQNSSITVLDIACSGSPAEDLFQAVGQYSRESQNRWQNGALAITRFFGESSLSQCNRMIRDPQ
ncbi:MAG: hypothetical protein ACJ763_07360, partial [Bdellovibrionia bacterium]